MARRNWLRWTGVLAFIASVAIVAFVVSSRSPVPLRVFQVSTNKNGFYKGVFELSNGTIVVADNFNIYGLNSGGEEVWRIQPQKRNGGVVQTLDLMATEGDTVFAGFRDHALGTNVLAAFKAGERTWSRFDSGVSVGRDGQSVNVSGDGIHYLNRSHIVALGFDGSIRWTQPTFSRNYGLPAVAPNGEIVFGDATINGQSRTYWLRRLAKDGSVRWQKETGPGGSTITFAADGTFYRTFNWQGHTNVTLAAFDPGGDEKWRLGLPERALSKPALGPAGEVYFTGTRGDEQLLIAVDPEGNVEWKFPLGWGHALKSPLVDVDGVIYLVTGDRFLRAITSDGKLKWKYRIPGRPRWQTPRSWKDFTRQIRQRFGLRKNELYGMPLISSEGILYVNFNHTQSLYAFEIRNSK